MGPVSSEYTKYGPGFAAFVVIFLLALALWLLLRNMNTRLRNVAYEEQREREAASADPRADAPEVTREGR